MKKIAINGLGRIGKLLLRRLFDVGLGEHVVLINDLNSDSKIHAHLLEFDTVHGRWKNKIESSRGRIRINNFDIELTGYEEKKLLNSDKNIDLAIDCTGSIISSIDAHEYFENEIKQVLVSAPIKDKGALNIVYGVNQELYKAQENVVFTAASCTTNCIAPVIKVLHEEIGIIHGSITTIHDVTNTQTIVDRPAKDLRRARSALNSLIPTTTGSATAISHIFPDLRGKLDGHAVRVPLLNASLTDCVFELKKPTTREEINEKFRSAADSYLNEILGYEDRPLVSADYTHDSRSTIIDGPSTMVINETQVKVYAWYDNEWGYVCRMVDIVKMMLN